MSTTIYYFSATGNCLTTAKIAASYYENAKVISVSSIKEKQFVDNSDIVGFVCPIYYGTMPYVMKSFIENITFTNKPYIFILSTCRGHTGLVASRLQSILEAKGQKLSLARNVVMPGNSWISTQQENAERLLNQKENIKKEMADILNQLVEVYPTDIEIKETPVDFPNNFRGIQSDEKCIGCGICTKVCPMHNIEIVDGKACIGNNCITCLRCFHWCPVEAIYMSKEESVARRFKYHHPDVKVTDFIE